MSLIPLDFIEQWGRKKLVREGLIKMGMERYALEIISIDFS